MNEPFAILLLGGAKRVSLASCLIEEGRKCGLEVRIYSYELHAQVPIACMGEVIVGKRWSDAALDTHLGEVIREKSIRMILPFVDPAIEVCSRLKARHPRVFIPCSSMELCRVMFDKQCANEWFVQQQIPVPQSFDQTPAYAYPLILKPRTGSASKGIRVIRCSEEMHRIPSVTDYLVQEYIEEREEYTVDCYVDRNGEILTVVPRIRLEVAGGEVTRTRTLRDETLTRLSKQILRAGEFRGPITIQFIRRVSTGDTYVMEINPRLGGGVIASIAAGANIAAFLLAEARNEQPAPNDDWKENTVMTRYFKEVIFYADHH